MWQSSGSGGATGLLPEKMPEASPVSKRAIPSWLQRGPAAGKGRAQQQLFLVPQE